MNEWISSIVNVVDVPSLIGTITSLGATAGAVLVCKIFVDFIRELSGKIEAFQAGQMEAQRRVTETVEQHIEAIAKDKGLIIRDNTAAMLRISDAILRNTDVLSQVVLHLKVKLPLLAGEVPGE